MFELIPCIVGAFVSAVLATRIRLTSRIVVAALAGVAVAVASGEAAAWAPAVLLDSMLAAAACVVVRGDASAHRSGGPEPPGHCSCSAQGVVTGVRRRLSFRAGRHSERSREAAESRNRCHSERSRGIPIVPAEGPLYPHGRDSSTRCRSLGMTRLPA